MKSLEFYFTHPTQQPLNQKSCQQLQELLAAQVPKETKIEILEEIEYTGCRLEYETQDLYGVPFRTKGLWHIDSSGMPHTTQFFATSTTARTAAGHLVIHDTIEPQISEMLGKQFDFTKKPTATLQCALIALFDTFGMNWLDVAASDTDDSVKEQIGKFVTVSNFEFVKVPEFTIVSGYVENNLHQASPRMVGEPSERVFGHHSQFR